MLFSCFSRRLLALSESWGVTCHSSIPEYQRKNRTKSVPPKFRHALTYMCANFHTLDNSNLLDITYYSCTDPDHKLAYVPPPFFPLAKICPLQRWAPSTRSTVASISLFDFLDPVLTCFALLDKCMEGSLRLDILRSS